MFSDGGGASGSAKRTRERLDASAKRYLDTSWQAIRVDSSFDDEFLFSQLVELGASAVVDMRQNAQSCVSAG
jgi:hypothetical protein